MHIKQNVIYINMTFIFVKKQTYKTKCYILNMTFIFVKKKHIKQKGFAFVSESILFMEIFTFK
jgi:hypothetical protein